MKKFLASVVLLFMLTVGLHSPAFACNSASENFLKVFNKNSDGSITREEYVAHYTQDAKWMKWQAGQERNIMPPSKFSSVTQEELHKKVIAGLIVTFDALDVDKNTKLDCTELDKFPPPPAVGL